LVAYLVVEDDGFDLDEWLPRVREAMRSLDLIVLVPVEPRDRIALAAHEDRGQRAAVDEKLHEILVDDALGLSCEVGVVQGDIAARLAQVLERMGRTRS